MRSKKTINHKIWEDKDSEFNNRSMKSWLEKSTKEMYLMYNEGKSVAAKRFIRKKWNLYMTSVSKNAFIDKLDEVVNKCNNTYHSTFKVKPVNVKSNTYIGFSKEINNKDPKFKIGDIVRIWKYKIFLTKSYTSNWSEEDFVIKRVKSTVPWAYVINDLNGEEIGNKLYENKLQKMN